METHELAGQAVTEQKRETPGEENSEIVAETAEGADVVAKMANLKVRDIKQPRLARPKHPEHVLPNATFTFNRPIWSQDLKSDEASKLPELPVDDTKQLLKTMPGRTEHTSPAFKFKLPAHVQALAFQSHSGKDEGVNMTATMAGLPAYVEIHPTRPAPQHAEHVVPRAAFTFTSTVRNPQLRPKMSLKQRNGTTDLAAKMAHLQVKDVEKPLGTVPERSEHALPTATFTSTFETHDPQLTPIFGLNSRNRVDVSAKIAALRATRTSQAEVLDESELVHHPHTTAHAHIEARAENFETKLSIFCVARVLKEDLSELMLPIYDFTAPPREAKSLEYLSEEFGRCWTSVAKQTRQARSLRRSFMVYTESEEKGITSKRTNITSVCASTQDWRTWSAGRKKILQTLLFSRSFGQRALDSKSTMMQRYWQSAVKRSCED